MSRGGNALTQTGATQYHAQLGLPDKGRTIKCLVVCNDWDLTRAFGPAKRSGLRLLSTVPCGIILWLSLQKCYK